MNISKIMAIAAFSMFSVAAQATVITFNDQQTGAKPNGYTVSGVTFIDTVGEDLVVFDQGGGDNALAVFIDDESLLGMFFGTVSNSLSITFGNDGATFTNAGDMALLTLFLGSDVVGQAAVELNRNGLLDQTISLAGVNFDAALFGYTDSTGVPINLTELVDNITFTAADGGPAPVPEPASLALLGLGLFGVAMARRVGA